MNKYILLLLTYTIAHCSNNSFRLLPGELFYKIMNEVVSINDLNAFNEEINKFHSLQKKYEYSFENLREIVDKGTIVQCIPLFKPIILLSRVNKTFHYQMTNFYLNSIKSNIIYLQHYMRDDIYDSLEILKKVVDEEKFDFNEMYKKLKRLECYLNNKIFIRLVGNVDTNNSILKQYLLSALCIPDDKAKHWAGSDVSGINVLQYYTDAVHCLLQYAFERRSNNIIVCTSERMGIHSKLIHAYLDISVRFVAKKNGLYYYFVNKRSNTINKESNVGFFIKKDSNQSCVIS